MNTQQKLKALSHQQRQTQQADEQKRVIIGLIVLSLLGYPMIKVLAAILAAMLGG